MDGFGSDFSSGAGSGKMDTGTIMEQVKVQIAVANAQELLQRMTDKCFKKCIGKPGGTLDNSEQKCIAMCMDRYMDAWNTVSRAYNSRLQRERARIWTLSYSVSPTSAKPKHMAGKVLTVVAEAGTMPHKLLWQHLTDRFGLSTLWTAAIFVDILLSLKDSLTNGYLL